MRTTYSVRCGVHQDSGTDYSIYYYTHGDEDPGKQEKEVRVPSISVTQQPSIPIALELGTGPRGRGVDWGPTHILGAVVI